MGQLKTMEIYFFLIIQSIASIEIFCLKYLLWKTLKTVLHEIFVKNICYEKPDICCGLVWRASWVRIDVPTGFLAACTKFSPESSLKRGSLMCSKNVILKTLFIINFVKKPVYALKNFYLKACFKTCSYY